MQRFVWRVTCAHGNTDHKRTARTLMTGNGIKWNESDGDGRTERTGGCSWQVHTNEFHELDSSGRTPGIGDMENTLTSIKRYNTHNGILICECRSNPDIRLINLTFVLYMNIIFCKNCYFLFFFILFILQVYFIVIVCVMNEIIANLPWRSTIPSYVSVSRNSSSGLTEWQLLASRTLRVAEANRTRTPSPDGSSACLDTWRWHESARPWL